MGGGSSLLLAFSGAPHCAVWLLVSLSFALNSALNSSSDTTKFLFLNRLCGLSLLFTSYNNCLTHIRFSLLFTRAISLTFQTPLGHLSSSFLIYISRLPLFSFFSYTSNKKDFQKCNSINHLALKTRPFNIMTW